MHVFPVSCRDAYTKVYDIHKCILPVCSSQICFVNKYLNMTLLLISVEYIPSFDIIDRGDLDSGTHWTYVPKTGFTGGSGEVYTFEIWVGGPNKKLRVGHYRATDVEGQFELIAQEEFTAGFPAGYNKVRECGIVLILSMSRLIWSYCYLVCKRLCFQQYRLVCLSVCNQHYSKTYKRIKMKFDRGVRVMS